MYISTAKSSNNVFNVYEAPAEKLVLPLVYSRRIYYVSFLTLLSTSMSLYLGLYDCVFVTTAVFLNSINYWRHPTYGIRRYCDMATATVGCLYQIWLSSQSSNQGVYLLSLCCGIGCYVKARRSPNKNYSSMWHCVIHAFGNFGNVVMYLGLSANARMLRIN